MTMEGRKGGEEGKRRGKEGEAGSRGREKERTRCGGE